MIYDKPGDRLTEAYGHNISRAAEFWKADDIQYYDRCAARPAEPDPERLPCYRSQRDIQIVLSSQYQYRQKYDRQNETENSCYVW